MTADTETLAHRPAPPHPLREFWYYFSDNPGAVGGLFTISLIILLALLADQVSTQSPIEIHTDAFLRPPFWEEGGSLMFPLGTDPIGRDMFSRLVHGTRFSLLIGSMVVSISLAAGICLGLIAGFARGVAEIMIMRLMDIMLAIPSLFLPIAILPLPAPS